MNPPPIQQAFEVSFERWSRFMRTADFSQLFTLFLNDVMLRGRRTFVALASSSAAKEESSPPHLSGAALCMLVYTLTFVWHQFYVVFWVFSTWLFGSAVIFLLFRLLGSLHTLREVTTSVGYAVIPLILMQPFMTATEGSHPVVSIVLKLFAVIWASRIASVALVEQQTEKKIFLFAVPLLLLNIYLLSLRTGA